MLKERGSSSNRRQTEFEIPVQAQPGEFDVEKAMVFPNDSEEDKSKSKSNPSRSRDLVRAQLGDGRIVNRELSPSSSPTTTTPPEFTPVTSNSVARLQLNPASMLQAAPGQTTTARI